MVTEIDEQKLANAAECGVAGLVRRSAATPEHLADVIGTMAQGAGHLPPRLQLRNRSHAVAYALRQGLI
ncbi:hypothetical protein GT025_21985 [Streptomyces sp. SID4920]|nr:hypothetical protein [Streptomyces sp. SID4920]MYX69260.1 hypothetical protein [Streptomyces sp. SID8373]